ncbi:hypothetical protein BDW69DRAFT_180947 [Aspergillus filifer]
MRFASLAPILALALFASMVSAHTITCWDSRRFMGNQKSTRAGMKWLSNLTKKLNNDIIKIGLSDRSYKSEGDWYKRVVAEPSTALSCTARTRLRFTIAMMTGAPNAGWELQHVFKGIHVLLKECEKKAGDKYWIGGELDHPDLWRVKIQKPNWYEGAANQGNCDARWKDFEV